MAPPSMALSLLGRGVRRMASHAGFATLSSTRYGTIVPYKLSDIGEGIREVTVKEWFVSPGDKVAQFDAICEVQSDKASVTITSRYDGHVRALHRKTDETVLVGDPLVDIELTDNVDNDDETRDEAGENLAARSAPNVRRIDGDDAASTAQTRTRLVTTPAVRRIASENNVDLARVAATGKNARILKEDLLKYLERNNRGTDDASKDDEEGRSREGANGGSLKSSIRETVSLGGYAKHMWKSMSRSLSIPHFVYSDECDVTRLVAFRREARDDLRKRGISLTLMPFLVKATSRALAEFPRLNAWLDEPSRTLSVIKEHNISVAMDTPQGLVVPNIKNVENLDIVEIAVELNRLQERGKRCAMSLDDISGGTFSLSNIGVIGGTYTKPVILPPQVVIGAVGRVRKLPRFDAALNVTAADVLSVSWAADHRVVDGVTMAKFSNRWRYFVENPSRLVL